MIGRWADAWDAGERFLGLRLLVEDGLREHGFEVAAIYRQLGAWQREVATRPSTRERVRSEVLVLADGLADEALEAEVPAFVERRLVEIARDELDVRDLVRAVVLDLLGVADWADAWLAGRL